MMDNELPKVSEFLKQEGIEVNHLLLNSQFTSPFLCYLLSPQVSLSPFATKWLMTIFCNVLPLETTLRYLCVLVCVCVYLCVCEREREFYCHSYHAWALGVVDLFIFVISLYHLE
jgi:hypothetical protein